MRSLVMAAAAVAALSLANGATDRGAWSIELTVAGRSGLERASHVYNGGRSRTRRITTRLGYEI